ncbi:MAG: O-antigen ligase family protein [Bdellovibrionales bacterium]
MRPRSSGHAHNIYIEYLVGTGIPGLLIFMIFNFYILKVFWAASLNSPEGWEFIGIGSFYGFITFLFGGLTESHFNDWEIKYMIVCFLALGVVMSKCESGEQISKI